MTQPDRDLSIIIGRIQRRMKKDWRSVGEVLAKSGQFFEWVILDESEG
jgi:hypothetical protein